MRYGWRLILAIALLVLPAASLAKTEVGAVSRARGKCVGLHEGTERTLNVGLPVHLNEEIATAAAAKLEITLADGTMLTLGERARIVIDTFVYQPDEGLDQLLVSTTGPFRLVSGAFKRPDATVQIETPAALIGVRGTDFWGGPIDGRFGVLLLEGSVTVTNNVGTATLDAAGEGVNIDGADLPLSDVTIWPEEKAERALATTTFN
ncbi:FecR family protein [Bauldia sp.]|uniref:FecR family protein n=1 Tax=Bauldia sp. TaxID=2575872 RepID=UPI003BAC5557